MLRDSDDADPLCDDEVPDDAGGGDDSIDVEPCPACGRSMAGESPRCPHCGEWITTRSAPRSPVRHALTWLVAIVLIGIIVLLWR
jgi:uncharacterized paraquat-inducible protein A